MNIIKFYSPCQSAVRWPYDIQALMHAVAIGYQSFAAKIQCADFVPIYVYLVPALHEIINSHSGLDRLQICERLII